MAGYFIYLQLPLTQKTTQKYNLYLKNGIVVEFIGGYIMLVNVNDNIF